MIPDMTTGINDYQTMLARSECVYSSARMRVNVYLHNQVTSECTHACNAYAGLCGAIGSSYACCHGPLSAYEASMLSHHSVAAGWYECMLLQPNIIAKATPAIPKKGANLGVRSASAMMGSGCAYRKIGWRGSVYGWLGGEENVLGRRLGKCVCLRQLAKLFKMRQHHVGRRRGDEHHRQPAAREFETR